MMGRILLLNLLYAAVGLADDLPYPTGRSVHTLEGLQTALWLPDEISKRKPASMVVLLHGAGDNGPNLIHALGAWPPDGYVVCAPSARGRGWTQADCTDVLKIAAHLKKVLPIDAERLHVAGYSAGGWALEWIAFDDDLKPRSATWIAAGYRGGKVPKWAKKRLGVLALAGAQDQNAAAAKATVPRLEDKVRTAEVRLEPGLGHKWPHTHDKYLQWWMGVQEGRFEPGDDQNFAWGDDLDAALEALKSQRKGGAFVYFHAPEDEGNDDARKLQNAVFMDPAVRHFGNQLQAVKMDLGDESARYGVKKTPAVAVLKKDGTLKKLLSGKIKARSLASALRSVAPDKRLPK